MKASQGMRILNDHIGKGKLKARVVIDQIYAKDQHESLHYKHPRGGGAKFLERALFEGAPGHYQDLADHLLDPEGPSMVDTMQSVGRDLVRGAAERSPRLFGALAQSGELRVLEGTRIVRRDAPDRARLSESERDYYDQMRREAGME